ncbi:MAG TPA: hypothetical protein VLU25_15150 [Acidobacteriota bacterium]|nr:hypothetical protein [Acidobacteriota bacterium]
MYDFQPFFEFVSGLVAVLLIWMAAALLIAALLLVIAYRRIKRIELPPDADFWVAIRAVPLYLVVALDLLDFALDFLSAPIGWIVLTHFGLTPLRNTSVVEMLIPFTQPIPTLTLAWLGARLLGWGESSTPARVIELE